MEEVDAFDKTLSEQTESVLSAEGLLQQALAGFQPRQEQQAMAAFFAQSIAEQTSAIAEAGTGTGKTFAYLVPAMLSGKRVIVSTATKNLQDQLFDKDLPLLKNILNTHHRIQILKGRSNYLCHNRIERHTSQDFDFDPLLQDQLATVREALPKAVFGERSELPFLDEQAPVWPWVTSTADNCLGGECPHISDCFLHKARQKAIQADIVVINHHLYFADKNLKDDGFGELLPGAEVVIFDEAHQLPDVALGFASSRLSSAQLKERGTDILTYIPADAENRAFFETSMLRIDAALALMLQTWPSLDDRLSWQQIHYQPFLDAAVQVFTLGMELLQEADVSLLETEPSVLRLKRRLEDIGAIFNRFLEPKTSDILWLERYKGSIYWHSSPIEPNAFCSPYFNSTEQSILFTSATLAVGKNFKAFARQLGIENMPARTYASPFDYQQQGLLYIPRYLPDPQSENYPKDFAKAIIPIILACEGRSFVLFTSHRALQEVAQYLTPTLPYPLLVQGSESKRVLLERFKNLGNAVLLGTASFWEGVDVRGDSLSCVIIDKIPFQSPNDPVSQGRADFLKKHNKLPFTEEVLPQAIMALKQGVGRLIRDQQDRGLLVIADPRIVARDYGELILRSIPPFPKTRDLGKALAFAQSLVKQDECIEH